MLLGPKELNTKTPELNHAQKMLNSYLHRKYSGDLVSSQCIFNSEPNLKLLFLPKRSGITPCL